MLAFITSKLGIGVLLGLALGWLIFEPIGHSRGERAGAAAERVVHEEQRRKAITKADNDRRDAQAEIDRIESASHQRDEQREAQMAGLERALAEAQANDVPIPTPSPGFPPVCRPAVPRSLSNAIGRIGAPAPRDSAPGAQAPVRGPR